MLVKNSVSAAGLSVALCLAACLALISRDAVAQAGPIQRGVEAQADPAYDAARRWFEGLPDAERRAIQDALVWTGDYNGTSDGNFGKRTRDAVASFAVRVKKPAYGTLDDAAKAALFAAADKARAGVRFAVLTDPRSGIRIGVPQKLLTKSRASGAGTIWEAADGSAALSTDVAAEADLPTLYGRLIAGFPGGRTAYKLLRPDFLVVTGENAGRAIYTRYARGAVNGQPALRGFSLNYPVAAKATYETLAIAIGNSFDPFPSAVAAVPAATPSAPRTPAQLQPTSVMASIATGVVVGPGLVLTSYSACSSPMAGGRPTKVSKRDAANGLTLLEAAGLQAPAVPVVSGDSVTDVLVLSFTPSAVAAPLDKGSTSELQVRAGRLQQGSGKMRVAAGLQQPGLGAAIVSRSGVLLGFAMLPADGGPRGVAGIIPESTYPLALAADLAASGAAVPTSDKTAGEVLASIRSGLVPVTCAATP